MPAVLKRQGIIRPPRGPFAYPRGFPSFRPNENSAVISRGNGLSVAAINGAMVNLLTGKQLTVGGTPSSSIKTIGPSLTFTSSSDECTESGQTTASISSITFALVLIVNTLSGSYQGLANSGTACTLVLNAAGQLEIFVTAGQITSTLSPSVNVPYFVVGSLLGAAQANFLMVDLRTGKALQSNVATIKALPASTGTVKVGNNSNQPALSAISLAMMVNNLFLSPSQLSRLAADPYSLWYPR